ncbi:response regulator [Streptomyces sp. BBFR2]|uniref:response regulator transcription factor n=1 Tax=Streptomyces sp. BBFR2 TaxID=3372854 RepID=UPI0037DA0A99
MSVSVVIADDQAMVRTGFRLILEAQDGITVTGEAATGTEAVEAVQRLRPDVCLMDIRMPELDGLEATKRLRQGPDAAHDTKIVIVTTFDLDEYVYGALRAGANGFVVKNSGPRLLIEAVHAAAEGDSLISPSVTVRLLERLSGPPRAEAAAAAARRLTGQELKVTSLVARGHTNNEIAERLALAVSTVKSHLGRIQEKLAARNRVEIAAWAWEHGVVS